MCILLLYYMYRLCVYYYYIICIGYVYISIILLYVLYYLYSYTIPYYVYDIYYTILLVYNVSEYKISCKGVWYNPDV